MRDRQTDRQTERERERQTDRQTDRETDRDRQRHTWLSPGSEVRFSIFFAAGVLQRGLTTRELEVGVQVKCPEGTLYTAN